MKNYLFLHLESLNLINYRMNIDLFPNLHKIEMMCKSYNRYYSTATSTLMVIGDVVYGGMEQYEPCESLGATLDSYYYKSSLFDDLAADGYNTKLYIYPEGGDRYTAEKRHIAGFKNRMVLECKYEDYLKKIEDVFSKEPFALMACNYISNVSLNSYIDINEYSEEMTQWEAGFRKLDKCVGDIWNLLETKNLLRNTCVFLYGDHGDDFWGHGMHSGLTHAIEPNQLLVNTPLFIYDSEQIDKIDSYEIVQSIDFRGYINRTRKQEKGEFTKNKYAFARSEYAAQPLRENSFNKAYSITDGQYIMMVSSNGLEMFDTRMDYACHNNLLRFFYIDKDILKFKRETLVKLGFHYRDFMDARQQRLIRDKYYELRKELIVKTERLYDLANKDNLFSEMKFDIINYN